MLERVDHAGKGRGVVTYQSPLLRGAGVPHAFSTRIGGVSQAEYASLNFGWPGEGPPDAPGNIEENFRRLQAAAGMSGLPRAWVRQVHGDRVELLDREPEGEYGETLKAEVRDRFNGQLAADGIVTALPGVMLTVRIADCVPVLLASPKGEVVAAVHAGWRGVVAGVLPRALRVMAEAAGGAWSAGDVLVAIGPGISAAHFEVGDEVAAAFARAGLADAVHRVAGKAHVDLQDALRQQCAALGVTRIDGNDRCTFRDAAEFFSHRREAGRTGRMVGAITAAGD